MHHFLLSKHCFAGISPIPWSSLFTAFDFPQAPARAVRLIWHLYSRTVNIFLSSYAVNLRTADKNLCCANNYLMKNDTTEDLRNTM